MELIYRPKTGNFAGLEHHPYQNKGKRPLNTPYEFVL